MHGARRHIVFALAGAALLSLALPASAGWYDVEWNYRMLFTARPDSIEGLGDLEDFPLLLTLDDERQPSLFLHAKPDGSDILITGADGVTVYEREVVEYDAAEGKAEIWIRAPVLAKNSSNFFIYYGNPNATITPPPSATWSDDYRVVYHFADDPGGGLLRDSSPQGSDVTLVPARGWTSGDVGPGQIGQAWMFNGTSHHLSTTGISTQDSSYVVSAWLHLTQASVDFVCQAHPGFWHISAQINVASNLPDFVGEDIQVRYYPFPVHLNDGYHHFAWAFDGEADTLVFYYDGRPQPVHSTYPIIPPVFYTGNPINPDKLYGFGVLGPITWNSEDLMDGGGDEFRIREGAMSPEWMLTEYRNQRDPQGFFEFWEEETPTVPVRLVSLSAEREGPGARIRWSVAGSGADFAGFHVHREGPGGERVRLTGDLLRGSESFTFYDPAPPPEATAFWIAEHGRTAEVTWHGPALLPDSGDPVLAYPDLAASPNPFRAATEIRFSLEAEAPVSLVLYDLGGRVVRRMVDRRLPPGAHRVTWDATTDAGLPATPGIYWLRFRAGDRVATETLLRLP